MSTPRRLRYTGHGLILRNADSLRRRSDSREALASALPGAGGAHDGALVVRVRERAMDGQATAASLPMPTPQNADVTASVPVPA